MDLIDQAKEIQTQIDTTFRQAYAALQIANMESGINTVQTISYTVPEEQSIKIKTRSIMGVEIPLVETEPSGQSPTYLSIPRKNPTRHIAFEKVKELTIRLSMISQLRISAGCGN